MKAYYERDIESVPVGKDVVLHDLVICGGISGLKWFSCFMFENLSHVLHD